MGSFIDPLNEQRKSQQKKLVEKGDLIQGKLKYMADKFRDPNTGQGIGPADSMMQAMRIEHLIDFMVPRHQEEGNEDPLPTSLDRLEFEHQWHDKVIETLAGMQEALEKQFNRPRLVVPPHVMTKLPGNGQ